MHTPLEWDVIGSVSFEERCTGTLETMHGAKKVGKKLFFRIADKPSMYSEKVSEKTEAHRASALELGLQNGEIHDLDIMFPAGAAVVAVNRFLGNSNGNVILDISCLPKRMFFLCLKLILTNPNVKNLIVTYSIPESYTHEPLALDTDPLSTLPLFGPTEARPPDPEVIIIDVGYLPFDLKALRAQFSSRIPEKVLLPFPPGPPSFQRNWRFLLDIFGEAETEVIPEPIRVDARDVSYAFDVIDDITSGGTLRACLMPFGPKPHSLAMALHLIRPGNKNQAQYTQPKAYHYDYSMGLKRLDGNPEVYGYCVKLNGKNLYE
jgi:hypothetical protein